jgi:hypothetical protein
MYIATGNSRHKERLSLSLSLSLSLGHYSVAQYADAYRAQQCVGILIPERNISIFGRAIYCQESQNGRALFPFHAICAIQIKAPAFIENDVLTLYSIFIYRRGVSRNLRETLFTLSALYTFIAALQCHDQY